MYPALPRDYRVFLNYEFLSVMIRQALSKELPANIITFSALASPDISPEMNTILVFTARVLALLIITVWLSMGGNMIKKYYRVNDAKCFNTRGMYKYMFLRKTFISPDPQWGPMNPKRRIARSKFDPKRALRYSLSGQCKHSCLLYSHSLRKEILYWTELCKERYGTVMKLDEEFRKSEDDVREREEERGEIDDKEDYD
ncbi:hypothetical protein MML48_4g00013167 [Holotrichia oblita]|uniref:Uncharacterized protein n=1 Tax=Holotrichia oblita TaxID=644536 RepID=A0ACB9T711_HOLOL|nr:hypothetical protein MML48_4g00013167 [Holotrichia oblita]